MKLFEYGFHNVFLVIAIIMLGVSFNSTQKMFLFECNDKIVSKELVCEQPLNNRCQFIYTLVSNEGQETKTDLLDYALQNTEAIVGNKIAKPKFSFSYQVNGEKKYWSYWPWVLKIFIPGLVFLRLWVSPHVREITKKFDNYGRTKKKNPFSK